VAVAPALPYGHSPHHVGHGGTMSVDAVTYLRLLTGLGASLAQGGCRRLFLVNGHGGNREVIVLAAREIARDQAIHVASCSWWALPGVAEVSGLRDVARIPGHAGAFETSVVAALQGALPPALPARRTDLPAHVTAAPDAAFHHERPDALRAADGYTDEPGLADPDAGARVLAAGAEALADALLTFAAASDADLEPDKETDVR